MALVTTTARGTHDLGYVFGSRVTLRSSATGTIVTANGTTDDMSAAWTIKIPIPEKMIFKGLHTVATTTGAVTSSFYSTSFDSNGDLIVSFDPGAEDTGGAIANDVNVRIVWDAYDETTLHATMFSIKVQSDDASHITTAKVRFTEGGTLHEFKMHPGDTLNGPFAEVEIDALGVAACTAFVYYQEH